MTGDFGPIYICPVCGKDVQMYTGKRLMFPTLVEFNEHGHMIVHRHRLWPAVVDRMLECTCGAEVFDRTEERGVVRLNWDGSVHVCEPHHAESAKTEERDPEVVESAEPDVPKGVLGWERQSYAERETP